jgi:hypothetical protein
VEKEHFMAKSKDHTNQSGEKEPGKFHYNPGNMSGKTIEIGKNKSEQDNNVDRIRSRHEQVKSRDGCK